jgi:tetratricopeptide (TPR) repeat protein
MAYRESPDRSVERCHRHPAAGAAAMCARCLQPICELCVVYTRATTTCAPCAKALRQRALIGRIAMVVTIVAIAAGAFLYLRSLPPSFDYGAQAPLVRAARQKMEAERCDHKATLELEQAILRAGDNRGTLADVDEFTKKCGEWYRVRWNSYEAYRRLNDNAHAVEEATKLIQHNPSDQDYRWWRAIAYEDLGKLVEAEADYRESLRIRPDMSNIPFNLADVLEKEGKQCDAKEVIEQFVHYHPNAASDEKVMSHIARLADAGKCK